MTTPSDPATEAKASASLSVQAEQALTGVGRVALIGGSGAYIDVTGAVLAHEELALDAPTRPLP